MRINIFIKSMQDETKVAFFTFVGYNFFVWFYMDCLQYYNIMQ